MGQLRENICGFYGRMYKEVKIMRVLIAGFTTKKYMPYLDKYLEVLKLHSCDYDIVYMDRSDDSESVKIGNEFYFNYKMPIEKRVWSKFLPYWGYMHYVGKILQEGNYDKIIFLTTAPAVLLAKFYLNKYKNKYIFDYRDYTFEKIGIYRKLVERIIDDSYASFISSKGFEKFVGQHKNLYLTHNISNVEDTCDLTSNDEITQNIMIGFVGCVRYFDVNSILIDKLKESDEIKLSYVGPTYDDCNLKEYCEKNGIKNVSFVDSFDNKEKANLYKKITVVNSIYSLKSPEVLQAIPNRLYDAAIYKRPILVAKGTYLEEIVNKYELGIAVDVYEDDVEVMIREYFKNFDYVVFNNQCNRFLEDVLQDENKWFEIVSGFLTDIQ